MARFVLLQTLDATIDPPEFLGAPDLAAPADPRPDVVPEFVSAGKNGHFDFTIPFYDRTTSTPLQALHVSLYPKVLGATTPPIPDDPDQVVKPELHYRTDTSLIHGAPVTVDASGATPGDYSAAIVAEYAS